VTKCCDVLEYAAERPFDLVCTHNFLGRFDPEARHRLAARWHALLKPGGVVVTTQQIKPNFHPDNSALAPAQARELSARVVAAAAAHRSSLGVDLGDLGQAVYEFGIRKRDHTMRSMHEVTDAFDAARFEIVLADQGGGKAERDRDSRSSAHGPGSYRMRLVARKP
jgi:SAM-dependent methyltransferase